VGTDALEAPSQEVNGSKATTKTINKHNFFLSILSLLHPQYVLSEPANGWRCAALGYCVAP
jgi:hypothetical protein